MVDRGVLTPEEARVWPRRNVITRAVGVEDHPATDIELGQTRADDIFVLGTDGLTAHVTERKFAMRWLPMSRRTPANELIDKVLERGGTDNVTIIVVKCREVS